MRKKVWIGVVVLIMLVCLSACGNPYKDVKRMDVSFLDKKGKPTDTAMITKEEEITKVKELFNQISWKKEMPKMARAADVNVTLFHETNKNTPENMKSYDVWFDQEEGKASFMTNGEFGKLSKTEADAFKKLIDFTSENKK